MSNTSTTAGFLSLTAQNCCQQRWVGSPGASHDNVVRRSKDAFVDLLKNSYRVLLSRRLKGCYVHFMDKETEMFVKSRIEN